jgi:hypothetical protein
MENGIFFRHILSKSDFGKKRRFSEENALLDKCLVIRKFIMCSRKNCMVRYFRVVSYSFNASGTYYFRATSELFGMTDSRIELLSTYTYGTLTHSFISIPIHYSFISIPHQDTYFLLLEKNSLSRHFALRYICLSKKNPFFRNSSLFRDTHSFSVLLNRRTFS